MNTRNLMDRTKELRNENCRFMDQLGGDAATAIAAAGKAIAEAYAAAGVPQRWVAMDTEMVVRQLRKVHEAMEAVHYGTDGLASVLDAVNQRLRRRDADTIF